MSTTTLTAIVAGFPPGLRPPKPLPGENMLQLVIRNYPKQWRNCVDLLRRDYNASEAVCSKLSQGEAIADLSPDIQQQIERWVNFRLPTHRRTLQQLVEIRDGLKKRKGAPLQIELSEIIWPRPKNLPDDTEAKQAASLGATVVRLDGQERGLLDTESLLNHIHGDYFWILPGGTHLFGPTTEIALIRVLREFQKDPKLALYSDQCYCIIVRSSALRSLIASGKKLSPDLRENAKMLQEAGFQIASNSDPDTRLAEIEALYVGRDDRLRKTSKFVSETGGTSWWRRLLGG